MRAVVVLVSAVVGLAVLIAAAVPAAAGPVVQPRPGAAVDGPVTVVLRSPDAVPSLRLNGRAVTRRGDWGPGGRMRVRLGAADGLRHGANRLDVVVPGAGAPAREVVRFRVRTGRPLAGARALGPVAAGAPVRLSAERSRRAPGATTPLTAGWRLLSAPAGSRHHTRGVASGRAGCPANRATGPGGALRPQSRAAHRAARVARHEGDRTVRGRVRARHGLRAEFVPDVPGCYAVALTVRHPRRAQAGHRAAQAAATGAGTDVVTVVVPPAPQVGLDLMADGADGIAVGDDLYPAGPAQRAGDRAPAALQVVALDARTLEPVSGFAAGSTHAVATGPGNVTYYCPGPGASDGCGDALGADLAALTAAEGPGGALVLAAVQDPVDGDGAGWTTDPSVVAGLASAGVQVAGPPASYAPGTFSAVGATGLAAGAAATFVSETDPDIGITGALRLGRAGTYAPVATDPVAIDTCATCRAGAAATATANTVTVGDPAGGAPDTYTASLRSGARGGFQLLALDAHTLAPLHRAVVQTVPTPAPGVLAGAVAALRADVAGQDHVLVVQSIGSPAETAYAMTDGWNALADLVADAGGSREGILAMAGAGPLAAPAATGLPGQSYALVGGSMLAGTATAAESGSVLAALRPGDPATPTPGRLTGALMRRGGGEWLYRPAVTEGGSAGAPLVAAAGDTSPGGGWPAGDAAAMAWLAGRLAEAFPGSFSGTDVRVPEYWALPLDADGWGAVAGTLQGIACPEDPAGFATSACTGLQAQLVAEMRLLAASHAYLDGLAARMDPDPSGPVGRDLAAVAGAAFQGAQPAAGRMEWDTLLGALLAPDVAVDPGARRLLYDATALGVEQAVPAAGGGWGGVRGAPVGPSTASADIARSLGAASDALGAPAPAGGAGLAAVIASDWGRLQAVGALAGCDVSSVAAASGCAAGTAGPSAGDLGTTYRVAATRSAFATLVPMVGPPSVIRGAAVGATRFTSGEATAAQGLTCMQFENLVFSFAPLFAPWQPLSGLTPGAQTVVPRALDPVAGPLHDLWALSPLQLDPTAALSQDDELDDELTGPPPVPLAAATAAMFAPLAPGAPATGAGLAPSRFIPAMAATPAPEWPAPPAGPVAASSVTSCSLEPGGPPTPQVVGFVL